MWSYLFGPNSYIKSGKFVQRAEIQLLGNFLRKQVSCARFVPACWLAVYSRMPFSRSKKPKTCSETSLTGKSRFHISPPRGFEPVTLVAGSKQVSPLDQWDIVRIMWDCRLSTGLPPSSRLRGCEARRETCSERETGTGKLCEIKWDCHIVGTRV